MFIPICNYTFERNHRLVDAVLWMRTICFQTPLRHLGDHRKHLLQPMVSGLIPRRQGHVVDEMEVARYLLEPVMCNAGGDESVVELLIPRPVVPNLGQPVGGSLKVWGGSWEVVCYRHVHVVSCIYMCGGYEQCVYVCWV